MGDTRECEVCGALYEIEVRKVPYRDKDSFDCECGNELERWSGSEVPRYYLTRPGRSQKGST
jgi:hypothetical protein